jgi:hypothetical protein
VEDLKGPIGTAECGEKRVKAKKSLSSEKQVPGLSSGLSTCLTRITTPRTAWNSAAAYPFRMCPDSRLQTPGSRPQGRGSDEPPKTQLCREQAREESLSPPDRCKSPASVEVSGGFTRSELLILYGVQYLTRPARGGNPLPNYCTVLYLQLIQGLVVHRGLPSPAYSRNPPTGGK